MPSNAVAYSLGGLAGLGALLDRLDRQRRAEAFQEMSLAKDQGTFVPVAPGEGPPQTFLERLLGGAPTPGYYDLGGGKRYKLQPYPELGEAGARAMGLSTPVTESYEPMQALTPLADSPVGPALTSLPTPSSITTDTVPPAIARLRLSPKTTETLTLEQLRDNARLKRAQALEAGRAERARLVAQRDPAGVARLKWVATGLDSDDADVQAVAQAELERVRGRRAAPPGTPPQSSTGSSTDQGPTPRMRAAYRKLYQDMDAEAAAQDLKDTLTTDPLARSLVTQSKMLAYTTLWPARPMQLQVPALAQPPTAPEPAAPRQERSTPPAPAQTPQAQAVMQQYLTHYGQFSEQQLQQEARRLLRQDPLGTNVVTRFRLAAVRQLLTPPQSSAPALATDEP